MAEDFPGLDRDWRIEELLDEGSKLAGRSSTHPGDKDEEFYTRLSESMSFHFGNSSVYMVPKSSVSNADIYVKAGDGSEHELRMDGEEYLKKLRRWNYEDNSQYRLNLLGKV